MAEGLPFTPDKNKVEPHNERQEILFERLFEDGDLIADDKFLEDIATSTDPNEPEQRISYLERAAIRTYTSTDDFTKYFEKFPQDANYIADLCANPPIEPSGRRRNTILLAKTFEAAAKCIEGRWQEIEQKQVEDPHSPNNQRLKRVVALCERSKLARS